MKKQLYTFLAIAGFLGYVAWNKVTDTFKYYGDLLVIIGVVVTLHS